MKHRISGLRRALATLALRSPLLLLSACSGEVSEAPAEDVEWNDAASVPALAMTNDVAMVDARGLDWFSIDFNNARFSRVDLADTTNFRSQPKVSGANVVILARDSVTKAGQLAASSLLRYTEENPRQPSRLAMPADFDTVEVSPSGRWALAFASGQDSSSTLQSAGLIALVDLQLEKVHTLTLQGALNASRTAIFPEVDGSEGAEFDVQGRNVELLLIRSDEQISMIDLQAFANGEAPARPAKDLRFSSVLSEAFTVAKVRPAGGSVDRPALFLARPDSNDIAMVSLYTDTNADAGLGTQLNLLQSHPQSEEMHFLAQNGRSYVITAGRNAYVLCDLAAGTIREVPSGASVRNFVLRNGARGSQLVAWAASDTRIGLVDLIDIDNPLGARARTIDIGDNIANVRMLDDSTALVATGSGLAFVDLAREETLPYRTGGPVDLKSAVITPTHIYLRRQQMRNSILQFSRADRSGREVALNASAAALIDHSDRGELLIVHPGIHGTFSVLKLDESGVIAANTYIGLVDATILDQRRTH